MVQLFVFSEYFEEKEKRAPITGALQTYFRRFDVTKNVTELVKIGVNQCNMETENPNILRLSGAFNTRYWGFPDTGADDGNRTRVFGLGSGHSAIELHLRLLPSYYTPKLPVCQENPSNFFKIARIFLFAWLLCLRKGAPSPSKVFPLNFSRITLYIREGMWYNRREKHDRRRLQCSGF